jgi:hypothetical protein
MVMSRLEFYRATYVREQWVEGYQTFGDYTQGNKKDSAASGGGVSILDCTDIDRFYQSGDMVQETARSLHAIPIYVVLPRAFEC